MIGKLVIKREPTDDCGCVRLEMWYWPNGGMLGSRYEYLGGRLYLREPEFESLVEALQTQGLWQVELEELIPYEAMSQTGEG